MLHGCISCVLGWLLCGCGGTDRVYCNAERVTCAATEPSAVCICCGVQPETAAADEMSGQVEQLTFHELSFSVQTTKRGKRPLPCAPAKTLVTKPLLHRCSASVAGGELVAVLGPSGAGKTTLLNMLTLQPQNGKRTGEIFLNGIQAPARNGSASMS